MLKYTSCVKGCVQCQNMYTRLKLLIWGFTSSLRLYDHKACRSHGEHRWGLQQRPEFHRPEPGERVIHQAKALCCLGGPVTDPTRLIGPQWEARPPDYMDISAWFAPLRLDLNRTEPKH